MISADLQADQQIDKCRNRKAVLGKDICVLCECTAGKKASREDCEGGFPPKKMLQCTNVNQNAVIFNTSIRLSIG